MGRPPIGKVAMTHAERTRRWRLRHGTPVTKQTSPDHATLVRELAQAKARIAELEADLARKPSQHSDAHSGARRRA